MKTHTLPGITVGAGFKRIFIPIYSIFFAFALMCLPLLMHGKQATHQQESKILKSIYQSGHITFKPGLKLNLDSFPDNVFVKSPICLRVKDDKIFILDITLCRVHIFSSAGKYLKGFGQKGRGPGDLLAPFLMTISDNRLVIWEIGSRRFSLFTLDGEYLTSVKMSQRGMRPREIKGLENGFVIVDRMGTEKKDGQWKQMVLDLYSRELKFVKNLYSHEVNLFTRIPSSRRTLFRPFQPDLSWDVLPGNKLLVGFSDNYELIVLEPLSEKKESLIKRTAKSLKVTNEDKEDVFAGILRSYTRGPTRKGATDFHRKHMEFPDHLPLFKKIIVDCEGNILVFRYSPQKKDRMPHQVNLFDAFDREGNFISTVTIQGPIVERDGFSLENLFSVEKNVFWGFITEDDFEPAFQMYSVE